MRFIRTALVAVVALGGLAVATPASAATKPSTDLSASSVSCQARFNGLTAVDIQEDRHEDEIFIWFGNTRYPTTGNALPFTKNEFRAGTQFRPDALTIGFVNELTVEVVEDDPFANDPFGEQTLSCLDFTDTAFHDFPLNWVVGSDVDYRGAFQVRRLS
jgi:hypothetical protein